MKLNKNYVNKWGLFFKPGFIAFFLIGCIEPYQAPDIGENISIMVVDGFLNATEGSASVRLTKAIALSKQDGYPAEKGAHVKISSGKGDSFTLLELDSGRYYADGLTVDPSTTYQLNIRTSDNREYFSDNISVTQTPPIDSVTWRPDEAGVTILVNTHDDTKRSRYYKWDFIETWEYHSPYRSSYKNVGGTEVVLRKPEEIAHYCYRTVPSTKIVMGSTVRLNDDVVRDAPLTFMEVRSSRLSVLYSILVRQRVIDKIEYEYLQDLQRVTESVGGLFDSQPYEILGNIHPNDPSISVLGFFSAGFIDEQRIFIQFSDLPTYLRKVPYHFCQLDTVCTVFSPGLRCVMDLASLPLNSYVVAQLGNFPGYTVASKRCADCRVQGGVLTKPDFWP